MKKFLILLILTLVSSAAITSLSTGFAKNPNTDESTYEELEKEYSELKKKMNEHMQLMHTQMDEIKATKDPGKRQELMREHEWAMYESMDVMEELGETGVRMPHENGETSNLTAIEERLDYMQKMMVQMMRHIAAQNAYVK